MKKMPEKIWPTKLAQILFIITTVSLIIMSPITIYILSRINPYYIWVGPLIFIIRLQQFSGAIAIAALLLSGISLLFTHLYTPAKTRMVALYLLSTVIGWPIAWLLSNNIVRATTTTYLAAIGIVSLLTILPLAYLKKQKRKN